MLTDLDLAEMQEIQDALCRMFLLDYVRLCFPDFDLAPWQIHLCERLQAWVEAIERGEDPRLMVHCPPQCGKTTIISKAFIAWVVGKHPEWDGIMGSYAANLSRRNSRWVRNRIKSAEHLRIFPEGGLSVGGSQAVEDMDLNGGHQLISRGVGGGATGNPAMYIVVDDPFKDRQDADSPTIRENVYDWYDASLMSRLGPGAGVLIMHTRWHVDDLVGKLRIKAEEALVDGDDMVDQWEVISFPAEIPANEMTDEMRPYYTEWRGSYWLTGRHRPQDYRRRKANTSSREWNSIYQQKPTLDGGNILKRQWFKLMKYPWPKGHKPQYCYQAWDLAGTKEDLDDPEKGCYSVGVNLVLDNMGRWWLTDVARGKWDSGQLVKQIIKFAIRHKAQAVIGEDPVALFIEPFIRAFMRSSGKYVPFSRRNVTGKGNKIARVNASVVPPLEIGGLHIPYGAQWWDEIKNELFIYPQGFMDTADALSLGFYEWGLTALQSPLWQPPSTTPGGEIDWDNLIGAEKKPPQRGFVRDNSRKIHAT